MRLIQFMLIGLLALSTRVAADDGRGNYVIKGAGLSSCDLFLEQREARSEAYFMMGGWIDGYVTAVNKHVDETFDALSFEKTELLLSIIANHCREYPDDRLFVVLNSLLFKLEPDRIRQTSPTVEVEFDGRGASLYQETIDRVQRELAARGLLEGAPTGAFDAATIRGLKAFQESVDFDPTGFPDQSTLWQLLRREDQG